MADSAGVPGPGRQGETEHDGTSNGQPILETDELKAAIRLAAQATLHTAEFGMRTYARTGRRIFDAVLPGPARDVAHDVERTARELVVNSRIVRRVEELAESNGFLSAATGAVRGLAGATAPDEQLSLPTLKEGGADLIRRSRDVWNDEQAHPAYERILSELAPDEGRVLMLLHRQGPQPSVDVRTGGPVGVLSSRLIAPGLTMIGPRAGLRYPDQVPAYLNNLFRLGLVWFSRETLRDVHQYQVVEAQPDVLEAMHSVRFAKIVRRSIHLTPFGDDFCRACLVLDDTEIAALPKHAAPAVDDKVAPPSIGDA